MTSEVIDSARMAKVRGLSQSGQLITEAAGTIISIPLSPVGREIYNERGGSLNLEATDIPERGSYRIMVKGTYRDADGKNVLCEVNDILELDRQTATFLMTNAGQVRPESPDVCDLSYYICSFRWTVPASYDPTRSLAPAVQQAEKERQFQIEREKERATFAAAEHVASLKKKKFEVTKW